MSSLVTSNDYIMNLITSNNNFAFEKIRKDPNYFNNIYNTQDPKVLWIGCSDSRTSPEVLTNSDLGSIFVLRNIGNSVILEDSDSKAVVQYAVEHLKIYDIMVVGHTACGAVKAALNFNETSGDIASWVKPIRDVYLENACIIDELETEEERVTELSKLNVKRVVDVINSLEFYRDASEHGKHINVNGFLLSLHTGLLENLHLNKTDFHDGN
ncbi:hypothetical protein BB561_002163 [Smittium simulii]|uniref:Carbonic anhydrase n=1 Tax=Smittium simulii TaxID=133385 RepID=A0A2T9YRK9_9FUNG|nr:hypothetical protein BB561_002163 [Smittium simulii]